MGVEIKLGDHELPVSPVSIDCLDHLAVDISFEGTLRGDPLSKALAQEQQRMVTPVTALATPGAQQAVGRAYPGTHPDV